MDELVTKTLNNIHNVTLREHIQTVLLNSFFFFFETEFRCCYPDWSEMARSQLTATSASWVQAILLPQSPK